MDRHTVAGTTAFTVTTNLLNSPNCHSQESLGDEYLENNCVDDPVKLCDFQLLENRIMKTVDSVYQVSSEQPRANSSVLYTVGTVGKSSLGKCTDGLTTSWPTKN